jgi:hypothetical protein
MVVVDASVLVDALLIQGAARACSRASRAPGLRCRVEVIAS